MKRKLFVNKLIIPVVIVSVSLLIGYAKANANPYAKYAGIKLFVNFPVNAHFKAAVKLIPEFTKETGIKVEVDMLQYMRMHEKYLLELSKPKTDYDLVATTCFWKNEFVSKGLLHPLAPFFLNPKIVNPNWDINDFMPSWLEVQGIVGGKKGYLAGPAQALYAIPFGAETSILAYRKDIFDKHGLKPPKTYDEMLETARIIREKEPGMYGVSMRGQAGHQIGHGFLTHLSPFGGEIFDDNWGPAFNKEPAIKTIYTMREIVKTGPPGILTFGSSLVKDAFLMGQASMYIDDTAIVGMARKPEMSKVVGKVGFALQPKAKVHSTETGGWSLAIPATSTKKEAAFILLQWLTSKENDKKILFLGGMPVRKSTYEDPAILNKYPELEAVMENVKYANPDWRPIIPEWPEIETQHIGIALHEAVSGKKTPEDAMNEIVEPVKKIMERAGYYTTWEK